MKRTVLVPIDGSPLAAAMVPWAWALASRLDLRVLLVQVLDPALREGRAADRGVERDPARTVDHPIAQQIDQLVDDLRGAGVDAAAEIVFAETVAGILGTAYAARASLIAMSTHGRSGLGRWLYGSVAEGVLRSASVPVLLYRAQGIAVPDVTPMRQGRHVLVPLDGSILAEQVLPVLAPLLAGSDFDVTLFGVVPPMDAVVDRAGAVITYLDQRVDSFRAEVHAYLERQAKWLRGARHRRADAG
jgi:nucleotide-binding universal stress UspA family protein